MKTRTGRRVDKSVWTQVAKNNDRRWKNYRLVSSARHPGKANFRIAWDDKRWAESSDLKDIRLQQPELFSWVRGVVEIGGLA